MIISLDTSISDKYSGQALARPHVTPQLTNLPGVIRTTLSDFQQERFELTFSRQGSHVLTT
jgi:hypothetical protein